jgi:hypothetical protein
MAAVVARIAAAVGQDRRSGLSSGDFMFKVASAILLCVLAGCASTSSQDYSVFSTQPGTYACQIEQYQRVNE